MAYNKRLTDLENNSLPFSENVQVSLYCYADPIFFILSQILSLSVIRIEDWGFFWYHWQQRTFSYTLIYAKFAGLGFFVLNDF